MTRLNDQRVKALPAPAIGNRIAYDEEITGFGVRVTRRGAKSFVLNYRVNGRERRFTIGKFPAWSTSAARTEASKLRRRVDAGEDPLGQRVALRDAPTIADLCDDYLASAGAKAKRTLEQDRSRIERAGGIREKFGKRLVAEITAEEIADYHGKQAHVPYEANRQRALLSRMFTFAMQPPRNWRTDNPCRGVPRYHEEKRERYLSGDELVRLTRALAEHPSQVAADAIRLMLLTGARRGEVLRATWDQFDLEAGQWVKPSSHTKQKREHRVPLSPPAVQLLQRMQKHRKDTLVFPGREPDHPITDIKKSWATICGNAGLGIKVPKKTKGGELVTTKKGAPLMIWKPTVRMHDLRHTYASILASSGLSLPTIGRLLGHTQAATTERYAHFYDDPLREATNRVGRVVQAAAKGSRGAKIIRLKASAAHAR